MTGLPPTSGRWNLGLFAKHWTPGTVKTRLAASIGAELAAELHAAFLTTLLKNLGEFPARRCIVFTPPEKEPDFATLAAEYHWQIQPQADGDLGARLETYIRHAFDQGSDQVVLIGADSPTLPPEYLQQAFQWLADRPLVIGPSSDGGYYLIGLSRKLINPSRDLPPLFTGIEWSTPHVFAQTIEQAARCGIPVASLPAWYDVDELGDLGRLAQEVQSRGDAQFGRLASVVAKAIKEGHGWKTA